jgi:hypothetical protein
MLKMRKQLTKEEYEELNKEYTKLTHTQLLAYYKDYKAGKQIPETVYQIMCQFNIINE